MSQQNNTDDNCLEYLSSPLAPPPYSIRSRSVGPISSPAARHSNGNDWTNTFCDLGRTVNVNLPHDVARNVLTLIRLG
ncbi:hypothetical protein BLA29_010544, partial [Euroglyphus maynei]